MMTDREELELILRLIKKHGLPISPIMEYSIQERLSLLEYRSDDVSVSHVCEEQSVSKGRIPLDKYEKMFSTLSVNVFNGVKAPNKAILLLSLIRLIETNTIKRNCFMAEKNLSLAFNEQWQKYYKGSKTPSVWTPYYRLRTESFWHFMPNGGNEQIEEINKEPDKMSIGKLRNLIQYAYLDSDLFDYMCNETSRERLRIVLIKNYICNNNK